MSLLLTGAGTSSTGGSSYGPYTTAFNNKVIAESGSLTVGELNAYNNYESTLGAQISKGHSLFNFALSSEVARLINFYRPNDAVGEIVNTPTYVSGKGYNSGGGNGYINTRFNPNVIISQNNAFHFVYIQSSVAEVGGHGITGIGGSLIFPRYVTDQILTVTNTSGDYAISANTNKVGLIGGKRTGASIQGNVHNGTTQTLDSGGTTTSNGVSDREDYACAINNNDSGIYMGNVTTSLRGWTDGDIDYDLNYTALQQLATDLGFNV